MGNKASSSKEKVDTSTRVTAKSARKGPLPEVPSADEVILRERRKDKSHESDILTSHSKDEFNPGAKVFLVLHDFDAIGHNTVSVLKNERVELRSQVEVWSDVFVPRLGKTGWIPSNYLAPLNSLSRYPWYHKQITRSTAEWLLRNGINGSFLVRESESTAGQYSLSVRHEGKKYHYRIQSRGGRFWINEDTQFKDLAELIHHHSLNSSGLVTTLTHPVPNETKPAIDNLTDEWEIDRDSITLGEKLGSGQYGEVYKGEWFRDRGKTAGIPIAVKTLKSDSASQEEFLKEAGLMKRLKHENLLHLLGVCSLQKPIFIITEYMPLGNLLEYIRNNRDQMTSEHLLHAASQIAAGMCFLEKENLVHRDLACRNCLVGENMTIRICDFGLSRLLDEDSYTAREGTKFPIKWTAPEALNYNTFTMKSDVWSFGIVLWELATQGDTPYPNIDLQEVLGLLETGYRMKRPDGCPEQVYKLMEDTWRWEPDDRPSFAEITQCLENMFTSSSVEEEVQRTLQEDSTPSPSSCPLSPNKTNRTDRSKSAPVDPSSVNLTKASDKRSSYRGGVTPDNLAKQMSFESLPPGRGSPKTPYRGLRQPQPPPPRHMTPTTSGRSTPNKYNNFDQYPQLMNLDQQPRQLYSPRHYPAYAGQQQQQQQPYHGQSPGSHSKQLRHHLSQQQLQQLQQQQLSQQQHQIQQQMQQRKLQQQQQRLAQKQHQEMWLRQQQQHMMSQGHRMHMRSTPPQHVAAHQLQNCEVTKNRSNSECSSNSGSSLRLDQDKTPGNSSPQSSVSSTSGSGTDLILHELKNRQSRRSNNKENNINKVTEPPPGACPSPKLPSSPKPHPSPKPHHKAPGSLPQKPVIPSLRHQTNGSSTNFCAVNPTSRNNLLDGTRNDNPAARAASPAEDFSFETILLRAKGNEKKNNTLPKPVPPPKPKINL